MKKKTLLSLLICGALSTSCADYLDAEKDVKNDRLSLEEVFSKDDYVEQWLAQAFYYLSNGNADVGIKDWPFCYSDDMYFADYKSLKELTYNEEAYQSSWKTAYQGIRQASIFIENIHMCKDFDEAKKADYKAQARFVRAYYYWKLLQKYGPVPIIPDGIMDYTDEYIDLSLPRNTYDECVEYIASEMLAAAKDLPVKRDLMSIARPTRGAALSIRARAYLYAASPLMNGNKDEYANQLVDDKGKRLLSAEYDERKWALAAAAAKDVMELNAYKLYVAYSRNAAPGSAYPSTVKPVDDNDFSTRNWPDKYGDIDPSEYGYADIDPFESYRSIFNGEISASQNPELIFTRGQNQHDGSAIHFMVYYQLPLVARGENKACMTQKQVDAYYMNDGTDCKGMNSMYNGLPGYEGRVDTRPRETGFITKEELPQHPELGAMETYAQNVEYQPISKQYANREPRFYASVAFNGATWHFLSATKVEDQGPKQIFYYRGGSEGRDNNDNWLRTGIGIMKFVRPTDTNDDNNPWSSSHITRKSDTAIRYADILLMYAEALNELTTSYEIPSWDGTKTYNLSRDINELKKAIRPVRCRAGIPDFKPDIYSSQNQFRAKLKRERQIELMGEGQRYFDLRRWKDAAVEDGVPIYGCNTMMTADEAELYHTPVESDILNCFAEKTYFWPIHRDELRKNIRLTQNPGWQSQY